MAHMPESPGPTMRCTGLSFVNLTGGPWSMVAADYMRSTACGCRTCTAEMNVFDSRIRRLADAEDIRTMGGAAYYKMKSAPKSAIKKPPWNL